MLKFYVNCDNYDNGANMIPSPSNASLVRLNGWLSLYKPHLRWLGYLGCGLVAPSLLSACASGIPPGQWSDGSTGPSIYSLTSLYDGVQGSREQAVKRMDIDSKNMCASGAYTLLSQESVPNINRLGEANFSRLIWRIECVPMPEEASGTPSQGGVTR